MENIFLSDETYNLLKEFEYKSPIPSSDLNQYPASSIDQLCKYGLIKYRTTSYDFSGSCHIPKYSECLITEKGKGYLIKRQHEQSTFETLKSMAESAEEQAKSAKIQAELAIQSAERAEQNAKKAQRDAIFSKILAILSLIVAFLNPFFSEYARSIIEWFSKLLKML